MTGLDLIEIVCRRHKKPHMVARYSDRSAGPSVHPYGAVGAGVAAVLLHGAPKWEEIESWNAAGARYRGPATTPGRFQLAPGFTAFRPMQSWISEDGRVIHANACARCGDNVPIPEDRMLTLLDRFSMAGLSTVALPALREADTLLRAMMDNE